MRIQTAAALAAGVIAVAAFGGIAAAAEETDGFEIGVTSPTPEPTGTPAEGDEESESSHDDSGLVCILVPIEPVDEEGTEEAAGEGEDESTSLAELLAENDIECSGTGNERSASVALVPRFLAHSDLFTGAEKGALISEWAKTHANKPSHSDGEDEELDAESDPQVSDTAPGRGGDHPGKGGGHGPKR